MVGVLLIAVCYIVSGWIFAAQCLKVRRGSDLAAAVMLAAMTGFYGFPLILGWVTGRINSYTVVLPAVVCLLLSAIALYRHHPSFVQIKGLPARLRGAGPVCWALVLIIFALLFATLVIGSRLPIRAWDAPSYHSVTPARWVQSGLFQLDVFGDPFVYPYLAAGESYANVKAVLPFLIMLWTGGDAGTALAQWPYLCLLVGCLFALYSRLGMPRLWALVAVIFCITAPEMLLQSIEAYADIAYFAGLMAVIWVTLMIFQDGTSRGTVVLGAMAFTVLAGTKPTALPACVLLGAVYLVVVFIAVRGARVPVRFAWTGAALLSVLLLSLCVSGPWYLHALKKLHNPIYPINVSLLGKSLFEGPYPANMNGEFLTRNTGREGFEAWWGTMNDLWRPPTIASWSGGLGLAALAVGLPCTILFCLVFPFRKSFRRETTLVAVIFLLLVLSNTTPALARFSLFTLALGGLALGFIGGLLPKAGRALLVIVILAMSGFQIYASLPSLLYRQRSPDLVFFDIVSGYDRTAKRDLFPDEYNAIDYWLDKIAAPDARLAITDELLVWNVFSPAKRPDVVRVPEKPDEKYSDWLHRLKTSGATHVCVLRKSPLYTAASNDPAHLSPVFANVYGRAVRDPFMEPPQQITLFKIRGDLP